jgi:hypothetical protein
LPALPAAREWPAPPAWLLVADALESAPSVELSFDWLQAERVTRVVSERDRTRARMTKFSRW